MCMHHAINSISNIFQSANTYRTLLRLIALPFCTASAFHNRYYAFIIKRMHLLANSCKLPAALKVDDSVAGSGQDGTDTGLCLQLVTATRSAQCCSFFTHVLDTGGQPIGAGSYPPVRHGRTAYLPRCSPHGTDTIPASLHTRYGHKVLLNAAGPLPTQVVSPVSMMSFPCRETVLAPNAPLHWS